MPFIFIGNKYTDSVPLKPTGMDYLLSDSTSKDTTFVDLGSFSTRILKEDGSIVEIKNFFMPVSEAKSKFPENVLITKIDNKNFIYGQDAIDFANLKKKSVNEIIKNKHFYFNDVSTFDFIKNIFEEHVITNKIVINEQEPVVAKMLLDLLKDKEVIFVNNSLAHLNRLIPVSKEYSGVILDIGYGSIDILFLCNGFIFEQLVYPKGIRHVQESVFGTDELIDVDKRINLKQEDGFSHLYKFFYDELLTNVVIEYLSRLEKSKLNKFLGEDSIFYLTGGVLEEEGVIEFTKNKIESMLSEKNIKSVVTTVDKNHLSLLYGLADKRADDIIPFRSWE